MILNYSKYKKKKLENFSLQNYSTIETKRTENYNIIDKHFENIYLQCLKNIYLIKKKFDADDFFLFSTFVTEFSKFSGCDDKKGREFSREICLSRVFHDRVDCEISIARRTRQRRTNCEGRKGIHVEIWESAMLISWMKMRCSGRWLRVFILEQ